MSSRNPALTGTRRWWPYLGVAGLFWGLPGGVLLVGYLILPDYVSGQCEGIGFGCTLTPKDGTVLVAMLLYPLVVGAGLLIMGVIAMARAWRPPTRARPYGGAPPAKRAEKRGSRCE
jgi:hypothetical protein